MYLIKIEEKLSINTRTTYMSRQSRVETTSKNTKWYIKIHTKRKKTIYL